MCKYRGEDEDNPLKGGDCCDIEDSVGVESSDVGIFCNVMTWESVGFACKFKPVFPLLGVVSCASVSDMLQYSDMYVSRDEVGPIILK